MNHTYKHTVRRARKYKYDTYTFSAQDLREHYKKDVEDWVAAENARRADARQDIMKNPDYIGHPRLLKRELANDWVRPVTATDYPRWCTLQKIVIEPSNGSFEFTLRSEMSRMDILKKYNDLHNQKKEDKDNG